MGLATVSEMSSRLLVSVGLLAGIATAQVPPGQYLAAVRAPGGEMYYVDPQTRSNTPLTISTTLVADWPNCVTMTSPSAGFIGTFNNPAIYSISLSGRSVTEKQLNTTTLPTGEVTQIQVVAGTIYFAQPTALWSMPLIGGAPTMLVDMTKVTGWPTSGFLNAMAAGIQYVYLGVWPVGELFVHDVSKKTTTLMLTLPNSKQPATGFSPVNMQLAYPSIVSTQLVCLSLYGDVATVDTKAGKVTQHLYHAVAAGVGGTTYKDSLCENTDTGDWALGSRDGSVDMLVPVGTGQVGRNDVSPVGSGSPLTNNRIVGIWYNPAGASYKAFGAGCAGSGAYIPTSVGRGAPTKGNSGFGFGVDSTRNGTTTAILIIGLNNTSPYPVDWTNFGAPSCFQHTDLLLLVGSTTTGIADGLGSGTVPAPVPKDLTATVHTQWAVFDPANALGIVLSDARTLALT